MNTSSTLLDSPAVRFSPLSPDDLRRCAPSVFAGGARPDAPPFPMTELTRNVSRRTRFAYAVLFHRPARIVVTLAPGDVLQFRAERRRRSWSLPIDAAFRIAIHKQAARDAAERKARKSHV